MLHLIKNTIYPLNCKLLTYLNFKITFLFNAQETFLGVESSCAAFTQKLKVCY